MKFLSAIVKIARHTCSSPESLPSYSTALRLILWLLIASGLTSGQAEAPVSHYSGETRISPPSLWLSRTAFALDPMRTISDALRTPGSRIIRTPGLTPSRFISRKPAGSRSETLATTAGTPQAHFVSGVSGAIFLWNQMSMRICFGIAQPGGNAVLKLFGDEMLQPLRLLMNLIPGVIQNVVQEALQQAMVANYFERAILSRRRKAHPAMLLVADEGGVLAGEPLQHPRYGSRADSKAFRQSIAGNTELFCPAQFQDGLEVVVDGFTILHHSVVV